MTQVTFKIIHYYYFLVEEDDDLTLEEYLIKSSKRTYIENEYKDKCCELISVKSNVYMNNSMITDKLRKISDIIDHKCISEYPAGLFGKARMYRMDEHIIITFTKKISVEDIDKPLITIFNHRHIDRACWTIEGKCINPRNVSLDPTKEIIGHMVHQKDCDRKKL